MDYWTEYFDLYHDNSRQLELARYNLLASLNRRTALFAEIPQDLTAIVQLNNQIKLDRQLIHNLWQQNKQIEWNSSNAHNMSRHDTESRHLNRVWNVERRIREPPYKYITRPPFKRQKPAGNVYPPRNNNNRCDRNEC